MRRQADARWQRGRRDRASLGLVLAGRGRRRRWWRSRSGASGAAAAAPPLTEADDALHGAAAEAVAETAEVARTGYREVSTRENAMFNLLTSFVTSFVLRASDHHAAALALARRPVPQPERRAAATSTTSCRAS